MKIKFGLKHWLIDKTWPAGSSDAFSTKKRRIYIFLIMRIYNIYYIDQKVPESLWLNPYVPFNSLLRSALFDRQNFPDWNVSVRFNSNSL